jgi:hypothetical protein
MLLAIAGFEVHKRLRLVSTYVFFGVFLAAGCLLALASGGAFEQVSVGGGSEKVFANSPAHIISEIGLVSALGLAVAATIFGQAGFQDFENHCDFLFFTAPIRKRSFLLGRFLGALAVSLVVFSGVGLGLALGAVCPFWVNAALFPTAPAGSYLWPYLVIVLPNLLFAGGLFFALGALGRQRTPVNIAVVLITFGYLVSVNLLSDAENKTLAALVDPFGLSTAAVAMRYWTAAEQNSRLMPLMGVALADRVIWVSVGVAALAATLATFRFTHHGSQERARSPKEEPAAPAPALLEVVPRRSAGVAFLRLTGRGLTETLKNPRFGVLVLLGGAFTVFTLWEAGKMYGTHVWPVTSHTAEMASGSFSLILLAIIAIFVGEAAWRERDLHLDGIFDALPVPDAAIYLSKLVGLCAVPLVLMVVELVFAIGFQISQGYYRLQPGLYLEWLFGIQAPYFLEIVVLAFVIQALLPNRDVARFAFIGVLVFQLFQDKLGLERQMFHYAGHGSVQLSDLNGFGHFVWPVVCYDLYWGSLSVVLAVVGYLFWTRGVEESWAGRVKLARARFTRGPRLFAGAGLAAFLATGAVIVYNTSFLNHFRSAHDSEAATARFEQTYKQFEGVAQPRITKETLRFDLIPETETLDASGTYELVNKTQALVETVYVTLPDNQRFRKLSLDTMRGTAGGTVDKPTAADPDLGWYAFELPKPLLPGDSVTLAFDIRYHTRGFKDRGNRLDLAYNGTFFNTGSLPHIGYDREGELVEDNQRAKYGLPHRDRLPDLNDPSGLQNNLIAADSDWVTFDATVSTSPDQIAIAPGVLEREWTEDGRRVFHYRMDAPILGFFSVLSARYEVRRDSWKGVALEIFYQPGHEFDLDEMMEGMKGALAYDSENFGPYQFKQARIVEFPRYESFAQAFAGTIPFSEGVGFIARVDPKSPDDIHYPLYITAHEISHQWWAHQVIGGRVQGVSFLDETLAQYSALMVMKHRFGDKHMRRFLRYELDSYLTGRSLEKKREVPLVRVEDQPYIHYRKGSLVMYELQDAIGEASVNQALRAFLDRYEFKGPPYPNANALLDEFKRVTPAESQPLLYDLFEAITLYDLRAQHAEAHKRPDGKYETSLSVTIKKIWAADQGQETVVPFDQLVDIAALDAKGEPLYLQKLRLASGESVLTLITDELPAKAGIDPLNKLIDRDPDDNVVNVTGP